MKKFNFFKTLIVLIVLAIIILVCNIFYKYSILAKVYDKNVEYDIGNNYHITIIDEGSTENNIYYKDGIGKSKGQSDTYRLTFENEIYAVNEKNKTYKVLTDILPSTAIINNRINLTTYGITNVVKKSDILYHKAPWANIKKETYNGKECYVISVHDETIWIDMNTFFVVRDEFKGQVREYRVEINTTTDDDVSKIDFTEYTLVEEIR